MKNIIGILLCTIGVCFGLYAGLWWAFIGGIVDVIEAIRAPEVVAMDVAIGVAKVVLASPIGAIAGFAFFVPGKMLMD